MYCCCSVAKLYLTSCYPIDCSTPRLPCSSLSPRVAQTHVRWISDAIQPTHPLQPPSPPALNLFLAWGSFPGSWLFMSGGQCIRASASVLPMNIQDWFPLGLTGLISLLSKGLSRVFSSTQFKSINSSVLRLLYGLNLTSEHDYWKNHSFDYMDFCWQSDSSAF